MKPPAWPPRRRPSLAKRQETAIPWLVGLKVLVMFVAPIGGATILQAATAVLARH